MIIDSHHHLEPRPHYTRDLLKACDKLDIDYVVVAGLPDYYQWSNNDDIEKAMKESKGRILGFAWVNLGVDRPSKIDEFKDRGFTGLKFIMPKHDYDHGSLYPIYERAEQLGMPGLFHFGVVAFRPGHEARDVSSARMRPIMIDPLARAFSKWIIIGAHLGNPWYREACMACRWHVNLYFDITGSTLKQYKPEDLGPYLWWRKNSRYRDPKKRDAWEKILFGSDVPAEEIHDVMNDYQKLMDHYQLSPGLRRKIWGETAAKILGIKK